MQVNKKVKLSFFVKAVIFILILLVADRGVGMVMSHYFNKMESGETARANYSFNKANEDVIILGSSRAAHHYIPELIKDSLKASCYNTGRDGQGILYNCAVLKSILKRSTPKLVILDLNINEFIKDENDGYDKLASLSPYISTHPEIQEIANLRGPYENVKCISSLYKYNSLALMIVVNNIFKREDGAINGYIPLNKKFAGTLNNLNTTQTILDSIKISYFKKLIEDTKKPNCELVVSVSPIYLNLNNITTETIRIATKVCEENNIKFINNSQQPIFMHSPEFFADEYHLNDIGAKQFTNLLLNQLEKRRNIID